MANALANGYNEVWADPADIACDLTDLSSQFEDVDPVLLVPLIRDWQYRERLRP